MIYLVISMFTITSNQTFTLEVKKSKFIAILQKINTEEEAKETLNEVKKIYPNAKHYTYAYIIGNVKKMSDDKEPTGTAGGPILNVLEKNKLTHVICIVVRYFGGILLGAPGLVRAYSKSTIMCLENACIIPFIEYEKYEIVFPYSLEKEINFILKDIVILDKKFDEKVCYLIELEKEEKIVKDKLKSLMVEIKKK